MYLSRRQHQPLSWCGDRSLDLKKKKMALYSIIIVHSPPRNFHSPQIFGFRIREATITISTLYSISLPRGEPSRNSKHTFEVENSEENWFPAFNLLPREEPQIHFIDSRSQGRERERIREPLLGNPAEESVPWDISYPSSNVTRSTRNPAVGLSHRF